MNKLLFLLTFVLYSTSTFSNVIITGTRVIYPEKANSISIQLSNNSQTSSLVQSWIDDGDIDSTPENAKSPFYLYPPIVKVEGLQGQQLKLKKIDDSLPNNIESVFYLNVLDIPKKPESLEGKNVIQLATRSRIKIFYRPSDLTEQPDDIIDRITYKLHNNSLIIKNNSQYHFTIASIYSQKDPKSSLIDPEMIPPLSSRTLPLKMALKEKDLILRYVDDFGAFKSKNIKL